MLNSFPVIGLIGAGLPLSLFSGLLLLIIYHGFRGETFLSWWMTFEFSQTFLLATLLASLLRPAPFAPASGLLMTALWIAVPFGAVGPVALVRGFQRAIDRPVRNAEAKIVVALVILEVLTEIGVVSLRKADSLPLCGAAVDVAACLAFLYLALAGLSDRRMRVLSIGSFLSFLMMGFKILNILEALHQ